MLKACGCCHVAVAHVAVAHMAVAHAQRAGGDCSMLGLQTMSKHPHAGIRVLPGKVHTRHLLTLLRVFQQNASSTMLALQ